MNRALAPERILRLDLGYFSLPDDHPRSGQAVVVHSFLIEHPDGPILFDTGFATGHQEAEEQYHPARRDLRNALAEMGRTATDIRAVVNCHLHLDHCGGNPTFPGVPIFAQAIEHRAAHEEDYTLVTVVDFPGATYELHDGDAEVAPGLRVIPTPGHVAGHQSLVVETTKGPVLLAGQAFNTASEFAAAELASRLAVAEWPRARPPEWVARVREIDPWRVLFAHDVLEWTRAGPGN